MAVYIIGLAIVFDLIALLALVKTLINKKSHPSVPWVSFFIYLIFFISAFMTSLEADDFKNIIMLIAAGLLAFNIALYGILYLLKKKYD